MLKSYNPKDLNIRYGFADKKGFRFLTSYSLLKLFLNNKALSCYMPEEYIKREKFPHFMNMTYLFNVTFLYLNT